jgi:hypothetical protein
MQVAILIMVTMLCTFEAIKIAFAIRNVAKSSRQDDEGKELLELILNKVVDEEDEIKDADAGIVAVAIPKKQERKPKNPQDKPTLSPRMRR